MQERDKRDDLFNTNMKLPVHERQGMFVSV
jgi:hypothetical protein